MKNIRIKFLLAAAVIGLLAFSPTPAPAQAQNVYAAQSLGTSRNDGSTATNVAYVIDCRKQSTVTIQYVNQMATSSTAAQTVNFSRSIDGLNWSTTAQEFSFTPVASAQSYGITNLLTYGCGYIKINYVTNSGAANAFATNTLSYAIKTGL